MRAPSGLVVGVMVLGAGRSRRMGRPKLLLPWGASTVVGALISQWRSLGSAQTVVVVAPGQPELQAELERHRLAHTHRLLNPAPERGMFSSIQVAASWAGWQPQISHYVIALGDQPHLSEATLQGLLAAARENPDRVCQPAIAGRPRHPVILPRPVFEQIGHSTAATLKEFLAAIAVVLVESNDPGLGLDLDTPADYEKALELFGPKQT